MGRGGQLLRPALLLLAFGLGACGRGVTLTLRDGSQWSGRPVENDATHLVVQAHDGRYVFCKRDVADADHAGNGALIAGVLIAAAGTALVVADATSRNPEGGYGTRLLGGAGLATLLSGVVVTAAGMGQLSSSRESTGLPASDDELQKPCKPPVRYVGP